MKNTFHILYRNNGVQVLYCSIQDIGEYRHQLLHRPRDGSALYVFYVYREPVHIAGVNTIRVLHDLTDFFAGLRSKHDPFSRVDTRRILELYDILHSPPDKPIPQKSYILPQIERIKDSIRTAGYSPDVSGAEILCSLMAQVPGIDWTPDYLDSYSFKTSNRIYSTGTSDTLTLRDVYYMNKQWYDSSRNPIVVEEFQKDVEYKGFKGLPESIVDKAVQDISEEVLFLDYIYDFYNFGEFWDVLKRLIAFPRKIPVFGLRKNRVTDCSFYFDTLGFQQKYFYERNRLYYFDTVHLSILKGGSRGCINRFEALSFNRLLNSSVLEKPYILYLSRGSFGRGLMDEEEIIAELQNFPNLVVINGSEAREQMFHYFTNAVVILGVHGSLMKNMVWCQRSPVFIEICPHTRANGDMMGNSLALGFRTLFFIVDCDEKERVCLNPGQKRALMELLDSIVP